jgi:hypothetical protein
MTPKKDKDDTEVTPMRYKERRTDHKTAMMVHDAIRTKLAFDEKAALRFLEMHDVNRAFATEMIARAPQNLRGSFWPDRRAENEDVATERRERLA